MRSGVLLDTGPLVAYLWERDRYHDWAVEQFSTLDLPFVTCEAVITEACFLSTRNGMSPAHVLETVERGAVRVEFRLADEVAVLREAIERDENVPMSLADACLLRLAERTELPICTLDSDFSIYRTRRRRVLNLIAPARPYTMHEP